MGKMIVEKRKKRKKKGRPSLLDLQKRSLKQQHHHHDHQQKNPKKQHKKISHTSTPPPSNNYTSATPAPAPTRRSTRRNPSPVPDSNEDEPEPESSKAKRRQKKLKLVHKLPSEPNPDSNASDSGEDDGGNSASNHKKRRIDAIADGSELDREEKSASGTDHANTDQVSGPTTPLPDTKLLLFILDRLQKKDTYSVFSEPVDPEELPDYHEVIEHPIDFGTIRKKLAGSAYANLEQFEKDVFLICSNAMQYNAPDTIYFRQAKSIQELARKNFENLRQDSDDNEPERKVVRRGRPPIKKLLGTSSMDHAGSEFSAEATLATGGDGTIKATDDPTNTSHQSDKSGFLNSSGRIHSSYNDSSFLAANKFERNDQATGSLLKGDSMKHGKKQFMPEENRRTTYLSRQSIVRWEPSVFSTFAVQRKQLLAVGLLSEYGYGRSLARFSANIGAIAWKIASKKIERSLPPGTKFGPAWVGENDTPPQKLLLSSSPSQFHPSTLLASSVSVNSRTVNATSNADTKELDMSGKPEEDSPSEKQMAAVPPSSGHCSKSLPPSDACADSTGFIRPRPAIQSNQGTVIQPGMNGFNRVPGNLAAQMGKLSGHNFHSSRMGPFSKSSGNLAHSATTNNINSEEQKQSENSSRKKFNPGLPPETKAREGPKSVFTQWKTDSGSPPYQKFDSVPPDLNVRFQSPGSPSSASADTVQPDLGLQL